LLQGSTVIQSEGLKSSKQIEHIQIWSFVSKGELKFKVTSFHFV